MSNSGSKYATLADAMREKVRMLSLGVNDSVRASEIEAELKRIDEETNQTIEEIKATPIDTDLVKKQAKADLDTAKRDNRRKASTEILTAEDEVKEAERMLDITKRNLELIKEKVVEIESNCNLKAQQEFDRTISSIGNIEQTLALKIQKVKQDGEKRKRNLNIELDSLKAKQNAHSGQIKCFDKLYDDIKEISLKIGDAGLK